MTTSDNFPGTPVRLIERLVLDDLPTGQRFRLAVDMTHDAMGRAQRIPLVVLRGRRAGPTLGITSAVHGNEINGIPVIHRLLDSIDPQKLRGTLVAAPIINIPGYLNHERHYRDGVDLNHIMPGDTEGKESSVFAHRFVMRIVEPLDVLIDLHTASFGNINSLYVRADLTDERTSRMAIRQRPQIILHNPPSDRTVRGTAAERGIPAITVEVGNPQVFQPRHIRRTLAGIRAVMSDLGMLPKRHVVPAPAPVVCSGSEWTYTSHGGLLEVIPDVATQITVGDAIARQVNVYGELVAEYRALRNGIVIGKSVNPPSPTGARILHLGRIATKGQFDLPEDATRVTEFSA